MSNTAGNKRIVKNTILLAIRNIIVLGVSLYTSRVVLRVLGIEDYGIYNVVGGFVVMFGFLNNAMTTGIQRFYNFELGKNGAEGANKVFITSIYTQLILGAIITILLESVGLWYLYEKMVIPESRFQAAFWIFQFSTISMVIGMMSVPYNAAIVSHEKMDYYAFLSIIDVLLKLIIVVLLPFIPADHLIMYGLLILGITIINYLLNFWYAHSKFREVRFHFVFYKDLFRNLLSFSGWNVFGKFAVMIKDQGLNMILNLFFGPVVNAARGVAHQVTGALNGFIGNVNVAVKPQLTQAFARGDLNRTFSLMFSISKLNYFVLYLMSLPVCLEIDFILRVWLGDNVPQYTNVFIIIVLLSSLRGTLSTQISYVVHATGIMKKYQIVTSTIELSMLPIAYFWLKMGGTPPTVFIVSFVVCLINLVVSLFILRSIVDISLRVYANKVVIPLLVSSLCAIIIPMSIRFIMIEGWARILIIAVISVLSTCIAFYFTSIDVEERKMVNGYIVKIKNKIVKK